MHWATQYIGKPWKNGARGPEQFDCWGLLWWIYARHLGITLPLYPVDAKDVDTVNDLISAQTSGLPGVSWTEIQAPTDMCAVAVGTVNRFTHVGIYLAVDGGLVLHCADGHSVTAQRVSLLMAHHKLKFYQWRPSSK